MSPSEVAGPKPVRARVIAIVGFVLLGLFCVVGLPLAGFAYYSTVMPGYSFDAEPPALSASDVSMRGRLVNSVEHLAQTIGKRHVGVFASLERARDFVSNSLAACGYDVVKQSYVVDGKTVHNLEAVKVGDSSNVIIGAHYDSAQDTPGADDNASGVAAMLEIACQLKNAKPAHTLRFVGFVNEEPPFFRTANMGSFRYAKRLQSSGTKVVAMLSLEAIGYYSDKEHSQHYPAPFSYLYPQVGNFVGFVANFDSRALLHRVVRRFRQHAAVASDGVAAPAFIRGIDFSDQLYFWKFGMPALMVTDTAFFRNHHYHQPTDTPATLDFDRLTRVTKALLPVVRDLAEIAAK